MDVRPGYKLTEIGVIPNSWRASRIGDEVQLLTGYPFPSSGFTKTGVQLVRGSNVKRGVIDWSDEITEHWPAISSETRPYELAEGDVVIAMDGALVGRSFATIVKSDLPALLVQRVARLRSYIPSELLRGWIASDFFSRYVDQVKTYTAIPHISLRDIHEFRLALPPLPEQRAIAAALSDVDALLEGLDRLIAKKRDLKQAAMQQLLTGKTRLPGFQGEWEVTTFGSVVRHHAGNSALIKGKLRSFDAADLFPAYSASGQDVWCSHFEHEGNAIVVSAVGSRCGKAFLASGKWCAIANTHVVWPNPASIDRQFLQYFINDENFWQKSGTGQPFVLFTKTFARQIRLPPLPEQVAICGVLSDMDAELAALEARRDKTRDLKQAMMQELLTGRTRLV